MSDQPSEPSVSEEPRFQFVRELGRGVLGETYEVLDESTGDPVVLKVFLRARPKRPDQFRLEFESLARLNHPNLVRFHHLIDPMSDTNLSLEEKLGHAGLAFTEEYVEGSGLLSYLNSAALEEELDELESRKQGTGEVPSVELPSGDVPSVDVQPSAEITREIEVESGELDAANDEAPISGPLSVDIDLGPATRGLGNSTDDVSIDGSPQDVLAEFTEDVSNTRNLDVVFLRLERVVPQIAAGLGHLHRYHKLHGNLRPSNVLVGLDGRVKFTDYAVIPELVYVRPDGGGEETSLLQAPENLPYVAPEVLMSGASEAGDIYALGCLLYEAIAEESPSDVMEMVDGVLRPLPLADKVKKCPASWARLVDSMLSSVPEDRPTLARISEVIGGDEARPVIIPPSEIARPESFVGREPVVEALRMFAEACSDERRMQLVMLEGETGIGKSQVLRSVGHWLSRRGWLVLRGRCYNRESVVYQGWGEIVSQLATLVNILPANVLEELRPHLEAAGRLFPELSPVESPAPHIGRLDAIDGLRHILRRISAQRPLLLYIQDLQWGSWDTSSLLIDLFSNTKDLRCLVVGTWQDDVERSENHLLRRDVELALLDLSRVRVRGYTRDEVERFARLSKLTLNVAHVSAQLKQKYLNPLLLRELHHEAEDIDTAVDELCEAVNSPRATPRDLLEHIFSRRVQALERREMAILSLAAIASGPLPRAILFKAAEQELSSSVLPQDGTEKAIEHAIADLISARLLRKEADRGESYTLGQEVLRDVLLKGLTERDQARLAGRIADGYEIRVIDNDLKFEYELRAGRVSSAIESALDAAEEAERRFAYHRAAKLWRWLLDHEAEIPEYSMIRPTSELARVEHLAGQHAEAAALYASWGDASDDNMKRSEIKIKEANAWLQAGKSDRAIVALSEALNAHGEQYRCGILGRIGDIPARLIAASSRWSKEGGQEPAKSAATPEQESLAAIFYFAADMNPWLDSGCGDHFEARLGKLAEDSGDATILGMARLKSALYSCEDPKLKARTLEWIDDAHRFFEIADDSDWRAEAWLHEGVVRYRMGRYDKAEKAFAHAEETRQSSNQSSAFDARGNYQWMARTAIRRGDMKEAVRLARRVLHIYRGDHIAALMAYEILAEVALLRGAVDRAEQYVDAAGEAIEWYPASRARVGVVALNAKLQIAMGRPEVAIGQLELFAQEPANHVLFDDLSASTRLYLSRGQALAASAELQKTLHEAHFDTSLSAIKKVRKELERRIPKLAPRQAGEVFRLLALFELLRGVPRRALKEADRAVEVMARVADPIAIAKCTEARGRVLIALERPEGRPCVEQALRVYEQFECSPPLVQEGWPVPAQFSTLKTD